MFQCFCAEHHDRRAAKGGVGRYTEAGRSANAGHFFTRQRIRPRIEIAAAVSRRDSHAEQPQGRHLLYNFQGKTSFLIDLRGQRRQFVFQEISNLIAKYFLFRRPFHHPCHFSSIFNKIAGDDAFLYVGRSVDNTEHPGIPEIAFYRIFPDVAISPVNLQRGISYLFHHTDRIQTSLR